MMRLRNSSRCWRRLMEPRSRSARGCGSGSATRSGIVIVRDAALDAFGQPVQGAVQRDISLADDLVQFVGRRRQMFAGIGFLKLQFADLFVNLALEVPAGSLEFGHEFAPGPGNLRQAPGSEEDQGKKHQEEDLGETEVHTGVRLIILLFAFSRDLQVKFYKGLAAFDQKNS